MWNKDVEEDEDEENEDNVDDYKLPSDRIVFLVDARYAMQENIAGDISKPTYLNNCLSFALAVMKAKIVSSSKESIGITFFGTREMDSVESMRNLFVLFPLAPPSAANIRKLQSLIDDQAKFEDLIGSIPVNANNQSRVCPLKQALWSCSQSFKTKDFQSKDSKRIWIFTNDDNPNNEYPTEQLSTVTVAKDCIQAGIQLSLFCLNPKNKTDFDCDVFYNKLLSNVDVEDDESNQLFIENGGSNGFDVNRANIRKKIYQKRRLCSTLMSLSEVEGQEIRVGVEVYRLASVTKKPYHTWLYSVTNEPVKLVSKYINSSTGGTLDSNQIETTIDLNGVNVLMTTEDMIELKKANNISNVGIRIAYFIPQSKLPNELNLSEPYFIFPDEKAIKGSSDLFEALLRDLHAKNLVAIVKFNRTTNSPMCVAALIPQLAVLSEDGDQIEPAGFNLIQLPFAEDIRAAPVPIRNQNNLSNSNCDKINGFIETIIQSAQFPPEFRYHLDIANPSMQNYYSILQALALNQVELDYVVERDDNLQPPSNPYIFETAEKASLQLKNLIGLSDIIPQDAKGSKKRSAPSGESDKKKVMKSEDKVDINEIKEFINKGTLEKKTVADLKDICRSFGLPLGGVKAELIERIKQYCK
eukprot:gene11189-15009_t